jgi:hypothetical protein
MAFRFLALELARWDQVKSGDLVLSLFSDERPLRGAAGLADWRLCGRLSRLLKHRRLSGEGGETLMLPPGRRLPFVRLIIFGLGERRGYAENRYRDHVRWMTGVLDKAGARAYAVQPPGRAMGLIAARRALQIWMEESGKAGEPAGASGQEISIIDTPGAQKEMAEILAGQPGRRS